VLKVLPASFILEWEKAFHSLKPSLVFQNALSENDKAAVVPAVVLISVFILCIIVYIQCYFFFKKIGSGMRSDPKFGWRWGQC
jgi:hypothetical protein